MRNLLGQTRRSRVMRDTWNCGENATDRYRAIVRETARPGMRVLHAGCGWDKNKITGPLSPGCEVTGVDLDPAVANRFHGEFHLGSLEDLPFADASFDIVVSEYVWEHLTDPKAVFRELARVMKPGAQLIILTPNKWSYKSLAAWLTPYKFHVWMGNIRYGHGHESDMYPTHFRCNTEVAIRECASAAGFEIISVDYINNGPTWFERLPILFIIANWYHRTLSLGILNRMRCALIADLRLL